MSKPICSDPTCDRPSSARGMCNTHYRIWRIENPHLKRPYGTGRSKCKFVGCDYPVSAEGWCQTHLARLRNHGDVNYTRPTKRPCSVPECDRISTARGFCPAHRAQIQAHGRIVRPVIEKRVRATDPRAYLDAFTQRGGPDDCWPWTGTRNKGYGIARHQGRLRNAHTVAWEFSSGQSLPDGMVVRHTCDNPPCVNPAHLVLGSHADNMADKSERGRWGDPRPPFRHRTPEEVRAIRRLAAKPGANLAAISRQFGCSRASIIRIVNREVFADLAD